MTPLLFKQESLADAKVSARQLIDATNRHSAADKRSLLMVNSNRGRITYRLRDIFAYRGWKSLGEIERSPDPLAYLRGRRERGRKKRGGEEKGEGKGREWKEEGKGEEGREEIGGECYFQLFRLWRTTHRITCTYFNRWGYIRVRVTDRDRLGLSPVRRGFSRTPDTITLDWGC